MAGPLVTIDDVSCRFGKRIALDGISAQIAPGSVTGLVGPDGAGKTTLIRLIAGLLRPQSGRITVCGFDDTALATTIWPELTTIHQPIGDMSRVAVEWLADAVRRTRAGDEPDYRQQVLDFTLIRRQSDAAPRRPKTAGRVFSGMSGTGRCSDTGCSPFSAGSRAATSAKPGLQIFTATSGRHSTMCRKRPGFCRKKHMGTGLQPKPQEPLSPGSSESLLGSANHPSRYRTIPAPP